jgi:hypothetical protein
MGWLNSDDWKPWKNTGSADVGPLECFRVTANSVPTKNSVLEGEQPSSTVGAVYKVNGLMTIPAGGFGRYQSGLEIFVKYDGADPAVGDLYGVKAGQGTLVAGGSPTICQCMGIVQSSLKVMRAIVVSPQVRLAWGTTTAAVAPGDATFTVSSPIPMDGSTWPGSGNLTVVNDGYRIGSGVKGKIVYCADGSSTGGHNYDGTENADCGWNWHPIDFNPKCADGSAP